MELLRDIFEREYVLLETEYNVQNVDTSYDEDGYQLSFKCATTLANLEESHPYIYHKIVELGAEDVEDGKISVYEGTVTSDAGTEACTVYAPDFWQ